MTIIWAAAVDSEHCTLLFAATTEAAIYAALADYCRQWWETDGPGRRAIKPELPFDLSDREVVEAYFQYQTECGDEWYVVEETPLVTEAVPVPL